MQRFKAGAPGATPPHLELGTSSRSNSVSPSPSSIQLSHHISQSPPSHSSPRSSSPRASHFGLGLGLPVADDDRRALSRKSGLPLYGTHRQPSGTSWPSVSSLRRNPRFKWAVIATACVAVWWWTRAGDGQHPITASDDRLSFKDVPPLVPVRAMDQEKQDKNDIVQHQRPVPPVAPPRPPPRPPARNQDKPQPLAQPQPLLNVPSAKTETGPVDISLWPTITSSRPPSSEKFLAYSTHSGYHNQRISLENALTLASLLGRTLLLPPVWLGHAIPYIAFDKLGRRLQMANKDGLDRCKPIGEGGTGDAIPRECEGYYDWTVAHWSFLVDLPAANKWVKTRDRIDQTDEWLVNELGLGWKKNGDKDNTFYMKDATMYDFRFYDALDDDEPLSAFKQRVDIGKFKKDSDKYKLVHLGSLFGTSRLRTTDEANWNVRSAMRQAMVSTNPLLEKITTAIRDKLGGPGRYYGLHLRVGDGIFQENAVANMKEVWTALCTDKMKQPTEVCEKAEALSAHIRQADSVLFFKRDIDNQLDEATVYSTLDSPDTSTEPVPLVKRKNSRPQREGAYHHAPLPPLPTITSPSDSYLDPSLSCRRPLHTDPDMLKFNAPLFVATDSKTAASDPRLAVFTHAFPCTFFLNDFGAGSGVSAEAVEELSTLARLRNKDDKVPMAGFLYPQLDAQIAAWGRGLVGTPMSTYSRFAVDVLHQTYQ